MPHLRTWHPEPDVLVVDELDLLGQVRVDVAVVDGDLWGYEIKSARDGLSRLPRQVDLYSRILDVAGVVLAERHLEPAMHLVPPWWEVVVVTGEPGSIVMERLRSGTRNQAVDPAALVQLLWRDEAIDLLTARGLDRGVRSKPRRHVWARLVESLELDELRTEVRRTLKARRGWRGCVSPA